MGGKAGKPLMIVTAAIIMEDGRVLINQRPPGDSLAGRWEFPGGKLEPGEDPREGLRRECREELGCEVEVGRIYETIHVEAQGCFLLLLFYTGRVTSGRPAPMEGNTLAWATPGELDGYDLLEADRPLVGMLRRDFGNGHEERA